MYTGQTHTLITDCELLVLLGVVLTCMEKRWKCCDVVMLWVATELDSLGSNLSCVFVEQRRMWCVCFLFKDWVTLTVVHSFFLFLCIKNKILNFHKCGVSIGILKPYSKLHAPKKMQLNSESLEVHEEFGLLVIWGIFSSVSPTEMILNYCAYFQLTWKPVQLIFSYRWKQFP